MQAARAAADLLTFNDLNFLTQKVDRPTRGSNILDLIFVDRDDIISHIDVVPTLVLSDHSLVTAFLGIGLPDSSPSSSSLGHNLFSSSIPRFNTAKGDESAWEEYKIALNSTSWEETLQSGLSVSEKVMALVSSMEKAVSSIFPLRTGKAPGNKIPVNVRKLMRARSAASAWVLSASTPEDTATARGELFHIESVLRDSYENRNKKLEEDAVSRMATDPAFFYQFAKRNQKTRAKIGPLVSANGSHTSDPVEMAEILSNQYSSVFSVPREEVNEAFISGLFPHEAPVDSSSLTSVLFSESNIAALSSAASPGPVGVSTNCYKWGGDFMVKALRDIFQSSMDTGHIDPEMKWAHISPIG